MKEGKLFDVIFVSKNILCRNRDEFLPQIIGQGIV